MMRSTATTTTEATTGPGFPGRPDLVRLSLALLGAESVEPMISGSLRVLSESSGRKNWALLTRVDRNRYQVALRGSAGEEDLRRLTGQACGKNVWLAFDRPLGRERRLGEPLWAAANLDGDSPTGTAPDLVLACWPPREATAEFGDGWLDRAAHLLAAATHGVKRLEELQQRSCHDPLTGLLNRRGLENLLDRERSRLRRVASSLSVVFLDLNRFKEINDRLGHRVGDEILKEVADRLRSQVRASDALARLGGDEFLVVLPEAPIREARAIARRLCSLVARSPVSTSAGAITVRVSCGVACSDEEPLEADLIDRADRRMLRNKGRNQLRLDSRLAADVAVISPS